MLEHSKVALNACTVAEMVAFAFEKGVISKDSNAKSSEVHGAFLPFGCRDEITAA